MLSLIPYPLICIPLIVFTVSFLLLSWLFKRNIHVECWFCGQWTRIACQQRNQFICPHCEQYNGFSSDGGYNRIIVEQHTTPHSDHFPKCQPVKFQSQSDILCHECTTKQAIITQRISEFAPLRGDWSSELKRYTAKLERTYPLCSACNRRAKYRIQEVDSEVLPNLLDWWRRRKPSLDQRRPRYQFHSATIATIAFSCFPRIIALICLFPLIIHPLIDSVISHACLVKTNSGMSFSDKLVQKIIWLKKFQPTVQPYCLTLLNTTTHLHSLLPVDRWTSLALLANQLLLFIAHLRKHGSKLARANGTALLLTDTLLLVFAANQSLTHFSLSIISGLAYPLSSNVATLVILSVIVCGCLLYCAHTWILFCYNDLTSQKQALSRMDYLPSVRNDSARGSPTSISSLKYCTSLDSSVPMARSPSSTPVSYSAVGRPASKVSFRPSILSHPPFSDGKASPPPGLTAFSRACSINDHVLAEGSDGSCITSASRLAATGLQAKCLGRALRTRRRKRRSGLVRFLLSLLFGRLDSWNDVVAELTCLFNAILIAAIIYAVGCFFVKLAHI